MLGRFYERVAICDKCKHQQTLIWDAEGEVCCYGCCSGWPRGADWHTVDGQHLCGDCYRKYIIEKNVVTKPKCDLGGTMSTNYYLQAKPRVWDGEFVGKTFGGYKPLLHAQDGLSSLDDLRRICDEGYEIVDNAGETYSFFQFREALELCRYRSERFPETNTHDIQEWIDDDGNCWTTREFS